VADTVKDVVAGGTTATEAGCAVMTGGPTTVRSRSAVALPAPFEPVTV
jgi:hypothetical protein